METKSVAIAARARFLGLPLHLIDGKPEPGKPNVGTAHGLLYVRGVLDIDDWRAAEFYLQKHNEFLQAIAAPGAVSNRVDMQEGADPAAYETWCQHAKANWNDLRRCLRDASTLSRAPILSAFDHILDRQTPNLPHMHGDLKIGLVALFREFLRVMRSAA